MPLPGWPGEGGTIGFLGRMDEPRKGLSVLLKAFDEIFVAITRMERADANQSTLALNASSLIVRQILECSSECLTRSKFFGRGERTIALKLREVRPVRDLYQAE